MATTCTPANLIDLGRQIAPFSDARKRALLIYGMAKLNAAKGGTDYSANIQGLIDASKSWTPMDPSQRLAALVELMFALAVDKGAVISSDVNVLVNAAKVAEHAPDQEILIDYLSCALRNVL